MRKILLATAAIAAFSFAQSAYAAPMLNIMVSEAGYAPVTTTGVSPLVFNNSPYGTFTVTVNTGVTTSIPSIDLSSTVTSSAAGTLYVVFSETGLTSPVGATNWLSQFSANFSGGAQAVSYQSYYDPTNTAFNVSSSATLLASDYSTTSPVAFAKTTTATAVAPYALTEIVAFQAGAGTASFSTDASITRVPEPLTLTLLGTGLVGLGLVGRRKGKRSAAAAA